MQGPAVKCARLVNPLAASIRRALCGASKKLWPDLRSASLPSSFRRGKDPCPHGFSGEKPKVKVEEQKNKSEGSEEYSRPHGSRSRSLSPTPILGHSGAGYSDTVICSSFASEII